MAEAKVELNGRTIRVFCCDGCLRKSLDVNEFWDEKHCGACAVFGPRLSNNKENEGIMRLR